MPPAEHGPRPRWIGARLLSAGVGGGAVVGPSVAIVAALQPRHPDAEQGVFLGFVIVIGLVAGVLVGLTAALGVYIGFRLGGRWRPQLSAAIGAAIPVAAWGSILARAASYSQLPLVAAVLLVGVAAALFGWMTRPL